MGQSWRTPATKRTPTEGDPSGLQSRAPEEELSEAFILSVWCSAVQHRHREVRDLVRPELHRDGVAGEPALEEGVPLQC